MYQFQYDIKPGRYRHFKGNEYQVIGMARHSETEEEMVVYRPLYGEGGLWARPAAMWSTREPSTNMPTAAPMAWPTASWTWRGR